MIGTTVTPLPKSQAVVNQAVADQIVANQVIANQVIAMERLKRRTDFRAAAAGLRAPGRTFVLQARQRAEAGPVRIGFTVSKQVGNAVKRNRVRRRLRETVRLAPPAVFHAGHDYVLIGRRTALEAPFAEIARELDVALNRIHAPERGARGGTGGAHQRPLHEANSPRPKPRRRPRDASAKD